MMRGEDLKLFAAIIQKAASGRTCALATIVGTKGSTPRKVGTKMLVDPADGLLGTVGGGCGEADVIAAAREVIEDGVPRLVEVDLTKDLLSWSPAVCGGIMEVFVEAIPPRNKPPTSGE